MASSLLLLLLLVHLLSSMAFSLPYLFFSLALLASSQPLLPNQCGERCGRLPIPSPFFLNSSCSLGLAAEFQLSCPPNSTLPRLLLGAVELPVLAFLSSGSILLDYSSSSASPSSCSRWYVNLNSFIFDASPFFGVTSRNVLRLYDCEDSSVCKSGCEKLSNGGCDGSNGSFTGCCYPLADGSVWRPGDGLGVFVQFGCRGFSSWATVPRAETDGVAEQGIEVEWAIPRGRANGTVCAEGAVAVNATAVAGGVRCSCSAGFVGEGYAGGVGCFKSCSNDGHAAHGGGCCKGRLCQKRLAILTGVLVSAIFLVVAAAIWFLLRQTTNAKSHNLDPACLPKILGKACGTRLFTYQELSEATKGFEEDQKLVDAVVGTVHTGVLDGGSLVAVQKLNCVSQQNLRQVLERVEFLSHISHKNITRVIGCCINSNYELLLVHEYFTNRTLVDLLQQGSAINWYSRINIATEVASALTYLQCEISPPLYLDDLESSDIFIDIDFSVKIVGFKFLNPGSADGSSSSVASSRDSQVVYCFGLILLELITGQKHGDISVMLMKISNREFHEIVDPNLRYDEELPTQREPIERVAFLAAQCLSSSTNGGSSMVGVAQELVRIFNENMSSSSSIQPALEETFSNSSLLQMISMSPDSLHVTSWGAA